MIAQLLEIGGRQWLVPVTIALGGLYVARGLLGLHTRASHRRKEFLELWNIERARDDLWLQVVTRHLIGCYLPAPIIRRVMKWPDAGDALFEISGLWPMLVVEPTTSQIRWKWDRHYSPRKRWLERIATFVLYVATGTLAAILVMTALRMEAQSMLAFSYAVFATVLGMISLGLLVWEDRMGTAIKGSDLINRLNETTDKSGHTTILSCETKRPEEAKAFE